MMDIHEILKLLPHRPPFLLVDKVIDIQLNKSIHAVKNITMNEPYFVGHFPGHPVMPGVLMTEALAQASGILALKSDPALLEQNNIYYFAGIDNTRFKRVVVPGDCLELKVEMLRKKHNVWKFKGEASVDGEIACSTEITTAHKAIGHD